jgi:hypothetical protein
MTAPRAAEATPRAAETIEQPAPTVWPMVLALGVTMIFAGLVTHVTVSVVGAILTVAAGVGWWRQVLPDPQVEHVPVPPLPEGGPARPAVPLPGRRLAPGEAGHRVRIPVEVQPISAGLKGGIVGGVAMAIVALTYGVVMQQSLWYPVNLLAAVAMPDMAQAGTAELRAFNVTAVIIGIVAHGVISILAGLLYALILPMLARRHMLWGGLVAPLLWTGGLWAVLGIVNPVLNARVDWAWFVVSQIVYGLAAGYVVWRAEPIATMQTWPLVARAGVEVSASRTPRGPGR